MALIPGEDGNALGRGAYLPADALKGGARVFITQKGLKVVDGEVWVLVAQA